jgi:hypothetical protein
MRYAHSTATLTNLLSLVSDIPILMNLAATLDVGLAAQLSSCRP